MPSNSSGGSKLNRQIYGSGSGGLNLNPSDQDEPYVDEIKAQRWAIFRHEYRGPLVSQESFAQMRAQFNAKFGYPDPTPAETPT